MFDLNFSKKNKFFIGFTSYNRKTKSNIIRISRYNKILSVFSPKLSSKQCRILRQHFAFLINILFLKLQKQDNITIQTVLLIQCHRLGKRFTFSLNIYSNLHR